MSFQTRSDLPIFDIQRMEDTLTFGSALLTRTCRWNPVPRHATALPMDGAASLALVQDWLLQKGLENVRHTSCYTSFLQRIQAKAR